MIELRRPVFWEVSNLTTLVRDINFYFLYTGRTRYLHENSNMYLTNRPTIGPPNGPYLHPILVLLGITAHKQIFH